jgi:hypothetical protein
MRRHEDAGYLLPDDTEAFIAKMNAKAKILAEVRRRKAEEAKMPKRKPKRWIEETLQEKCVDWFDRHYPELRLLLHHSPNEGRRSIVEGAHLKASGMRPGFPDLVLLMPSGEWHWLAMEFKGKGGRLSDAQKKYAEYLKGHEVKHIVVWSFDEFVSAIQGYVPPQYRRG